MAEIIKIIVGRSLIGARPSLVGRIVAPQAGLSSIRAARMMSSSGKINTVTVERISDNLSFRPATSGTFDDTNRPLVLIYAWLVAKSRHIHKFGDFYLGKGFDVLHVKVAPGQILWPLRAQAVAAQIVDFINAPSRRTRPILVHGFSVGGYLFGETLVRITSDPVMADEAARRIRGQIFDSPVDFEGVPRGVSMAVTGSSLARFAIRSSLESYMALFQNKVTQHYLRSSQAFHFNPLLTPSLMLYSYADVVGTAGPIEKVIEGWRQRGVPVYTKTWKDTPHVAHYLRDPLNYTVALNDFLQVIGLEAGSSLKQDVKPLLISKL